MIRNRSIRTDPDDVGMVEDEIGKDDKLAMMVAIHKHLSNITLNKKRD